jgi:hypothetical protein
VHSPGNGDRLEQFLRDNKKQPKESARDDHGDIEDLREPGCRFLCDPKPPEFPFHPRAEILKHVFPDKRQQQIRIYIGLMVVVS